MAVVLGVSVPDSIANRIELAPPEDLVISILREKHPDITILTLIPLDQTGALAWPSSAQGNLEWFVLVRRITGMFSYRYDPRFVDAASISVQVFCKDPDGDQKAALISEGLRVTLDRAADEQKVYPGLGYLIRTERDTEATRKTDWATDTGPVQFADLPGGYHRYEATYNCFIRRYLPPSP